MSTLDDSLGAIELGVLFSALLFGLVIVQLYTYYRACFNDGWLINTLVSIYSVKSRRSTKSMTQMF